jgi:hypothetical protein
MDMIVGAWSEPPYALLRLTAGTLASYGRPFQHVHFYSGDPAARAFSVPSFGKTPYFTYLSDALERGVAVRVLEGEERKTLREKGPQMFYHVLVVEVTRKNLEDIDTFLLTREAMAEFFDCLVEKGILCFSITHRDYNLMPVLADTANSLGFACKYGTDLGYDTTKDPNHWASDWIMVARKAEYLTFLSSPERPTDRNSNVTWKVPVSTGQHIWTDRGKHDLEALRRPKKQ